MERIGLWEIKGSEEYI